MNHDFKLDLPGWSSDNFTFRLFYTIRALRPPIKVLVLGLYTIVIANAGEASPLVFQKTIVWGGLASLIMGYCVADLFRPCSQDELREISQMGAQHEPISAAIKAMMAAGKLPTHADYLVCRKTSRDRAGAAVRKGG